MRLFAKNPSVHLCNGLCSPGLQMQLVRPKQYHQLTKPNFIGKMPRQPEIIHKHTYRRQSQLRISVGFVCLFFFVFRISVLTVITILRTTRTCPILQLHDVRWVKSQTTKHKTLGPLQAHHVTQQSWSIKLLVVTVQSNSYYFTEAQGLQTSECACVSFTSLIHVLSSEKQSRKQQVYSFPVK